MTVFGFGKKFTITDAELAAAKKRAPDAVEETVRRCYPHMEAAGAAFAVWCSERNVKDDAFTEEMIEAELLIAWIEGRFGVKWGKAMKSHPWLEAQNNAFMRAAKPYGFGMVLALNKTAAIFTAAGKVERDYAPGNARHHELGEAGPALFE
jgi:hypothetical protein